MEQKFEVELLEDAFRFLEAMEPKPREKILQNIRRAQIYHKPRMFKQLAEEIWEFRTSFAGVHYKFLIFWDKTESPDTLVIASSGFIRKIRKVDKKEVSKAEQIREIYFKEKAHETILH